jgi:hypothetical protein
MTAADLEALLRLASLVAVHLLAMARWLRRTRGEGDGQGGEMAE